MAKKHTSVVHLNGNVYNAATGEIITRRDRATRHIDGFRPAQKNRSSPSAVSAQTLHQSKQRTRKLHSSVRKKQPKQQTTEQVAAGAGSASIIPQSSKYTLTNQSRSARARHHQRSRHISKFADPTTTQQDFSQPEAQLTQSQPQTNSPQNPSLQPPEVIPSETDRAQTAPSKRNWLIRQFQQKPKLSYTIVAVLATFIVGGYLTYTNIPNMTLRLAAQRAGFQASLPGYKPSGFRFLGPVSYGPGSITVNYTSDNDESQQFAIRQQESNWDSQSLLENYVLREAQQYVTFQERGLIVYVYDDANATWVDRGIWYTIEGNSALSNEQLLKIAASL